MNLVLTVVALTAAAFGWLLSAVAPAVAHSCAGPITALVLVLALPVVLGCNRRRHR